jgi:hypothetical protein
MSKDAEHVKVRNTESGEYEMICEHCGLRGIITPPMPVDRFLGMMEKFAEDHKHCVAAGAAMMKEKQENADS